MMMFRCWLGRHDYVLVKMGRLPLSKTVVWYVCCHRCGKRLNSRA